MSKLKNIACVLFLTIGCVHRPIVQRDPSADGHAVARAPELRQSIDEMKALLSPRLILTERPMLTFRYENHDLDPTTQPDVARAATRYADTFYDPNVQGPRSNTVGPGVYAALDPYVSRGYGGEHPQLYVMSLRAGTRLLVTNIPAREADTQRGYEIATRLGCTWNSTAGEMHNRFRHFIGDVRSGDDCQIARSVLIEAFRELNIEAILYGFGETASDVRASRAFRSDAIDIISPRAIESERVALFSDAHRVTNDPRLAPLVYRLYEDFRRDFRQAFERSEESKSAPPKQLGPVAARTRSYRRWKSQSIAYFGPDRLIETYSRPVAEFYAKFKDLYVDAEARKLLLLLKMVIPRAEDERFDPSYFNGLERRLAHVAGMDDSPASFGLWQQLHDIKFQGRGGRVIDTQLAQILSEKNDVNYSTDIYSNFDEQSLRTATAEPMMIIKLMRSIGLGPKLTQLETQRFMFTEGATPFLVPPWPGVSLSENDLMTNRRTYRDFLTRCLALYQSPNRDLTEVNKGECGLRRIEPM